MEAALERSLSSAWNSASRNILQPETISAYLSYAENTSVLASGGADVNTSPAQVVPLTAGETTMRVFVTGATGFIGTELVKELIEAGHQVRGLTRSDEGMVQLKQVGAEVLRGDLTDLDSLRKGATGMDAVVNLAFNHDWSKFAQNAQDEIKAIE